MTRKVACSHLCSIPTLVHLRRLHKVLCGQVAGPKFARTDSALAAANFVQVIPEFFGEGFSTLNTLFAYLTQVTKSIRRY